MAIGYSLGQHRYRTFPSSQKVQFMTQHRILECLTFAHYLGIVSPPVFNDGRHSLPQCGSILPRFPFLPLAPSVLPYRIDWRVNILSSAVCKVELLAAQVLPSWLVCGITFLRYFFLSPSCCALRSASLPVLDFCME